MKIIITSLPHQTNDGKPTGRERAIFFATLRSSGVRYEVQEPCYGFWYADDGTLYQDETTIVHMLGNEGAIRRAVGAFGEAAGQIEMLYVPQTFDCVVGVNDGREGAALLAKEYGGATLLPNGVAVSLKYASLVAGQDYADVNVVR